jgi:hypothetical protein
MLYKTFISRKKKPMLGFKTSKDRFALLLEVDAAGNFMLPRNLL